MNQLPLVRRSRRNRRTSSIRDVVQETSIRVEDLIQPFFVVDGDGKPEPVASMPGVHRYNVADVTDRCREALSLGIRAVAIFPKIDAHHKDAQGSFALSSDNVLSRAVSTVKSACPELLVITDVALDPYTSHGHDGILTDDGLDVANDISVECLAKLAVREAEAGADWVAPSDMMDGRVGAIRQSLDQAGFTHTGILAYAAKFASAYYGPFRDAVGSVQAAGTAHLDKRTYQLNPANRREAILDALLDESEGADVLMVKPAGPYLDVIRDLREATRLPVAAYQVSGEYAQIHAAARLGWLDLERTRDETDRKSVV